MPPVALPMDTQLTNVPTPPAMVRFWSPGGSSTVRSVSTLTRLTQAPETELYVDRLQMPPARTGGIRAEVRIREALQFRAGPGDFVLDHDEE